MATDYFISSKLGAQTNPGTEAAPFALPQNVTSVTAAAGDHFWFDSSSLFDLQARTLINSGLGWASTLASPLVFGTYDPLGVGGMPEFTKSRYIGASEWTYSAPNNSWTFTASNTVSAYCYIKCGGEWATRTDNALPLDSVDGRWSNSGSTVHVYAPAGTNPTAYYGSVLFGGDTSDGVFVSSSPGNVQAIDFDGPWQFRGVGTGIYIFNSTGNRRYRIRNMRSSETGAVFYMLTQTAGAVDLEIHDNVCEKGGTTLISANGASGLGIARWYVHHNELSECNYGFPQGAIYSQVRTGGIITDNVIRRVNYGVPGKSSDGSAIYTETNSDGTMVLRNYIEDCYLAFQDNSGRSTHWIGNVINNCFATLKVTDTTPNSSVVCNFYNNTIINAGAPMTSGAGSVAGIGIWGATSTNPAQQYTIINNQLSAYSLGPTTAAIELPTNATGTIANNNVFGFSAVAESWDGTACSITPTNTSAANAMLDDQYMPLSTSTRSAGVMIGAIDFYGKTFQFPPTIGAVQYQPVAELLATRDIVSRDLVLRDFVARRVIGATS